MAEEPEGFEFVEETEEQPQEQVPQIKIYVVNATFAIAAKDPMAALMSCMTDTHMPVGFSVNEIDE